MDINHAASITAFYFKYKALLFREVWKYLSTQDEAEDIVCETLVRILEKAETFYAMSPAQQIQYARAIVRNLSFRHYKRSEHFTMIPFEEVEAHLLADPDVNLESIAHRKLQVLHLRKVWAKLPPKDRLLLEQKYILNWSNEQIASQLKIKPQSVRMYLTRAKRHTVKFLREEGFCIEDWFW